MMMMMTSDGELVLDNGTEKKTRVEKLFSLACVLRFPLKLN